MGPGSYPAVRAARPRHAKPRRRVTPGLLAAAFWGASSLGYATEANLKVEEDETTLNSNASACGGANIAGWSLVNKNNVPTALEGQVVQAHVASSDFAGVGNSMHGTIDYNFFVYPDAAYRGLLAKPGNFTTGAGVERGRLELEWEMSAGPLPFAGGFPPQAWPTQGDRVYVLGSHILDCGHSPYRAEIHAPRLVVTYRNAAQSDFAGAANRKGAVWGFPSNGGEPTAATRVDIFASSYGGESVESAYDNEDINLSELYPADAGPKGATKTWWQPINDRNYEFDVKAPPRPSPQASLVAQPIYWFMQGVTGPELELTPLPADAGWHVKIPFKGWKDPASHVMRISARLYVGWAGPRDVVPRLDDDAFRTYKVTVEKLHVDDDLENLGAGNWKMWGYVNEIGKQILSGNGTTSLRETWRNISSGSDVTTFANSTFQVSLAEGQPLRVHFRAVEIDNTTDDDAGTAEKIWTGNDAAWANRSHTMRSSNASVMGGEDEHADCRDDNGCYSVTYKIERIKPVVAPDQKLDPNFSSYLALLNNPLQSGSLSLAVGIERPDRIAIRIHDARGRLVRDVANEARTPGEHRFTWDGRDTRGEPVANGVYFALVRLKETGTEMSRKVTVLR